MEFLISHIEESDYEKYKYGLPINDLIVKQDLPRGGNSKGQIWKLCYACKEVCIPVNDYACNKCKTKMELNQIEKPIDIDTRDKLCQSCIERGYSAPNPATKQWSNGRYICDSCYETFVNGIGDIQSHFSDIITSEDVLDNRDKIFNFYHQAIINYSQEQLVEHLESIKKVLFTRRIEAEVVQTLIDKYRAKNRLTNGLDKSINEAGKVSKGTSAASKLKQSKEEKQLQSLAKTLGMTVEQYKNLMTNGVKQARQQEFGALLAGKVQSTESPKELDVDYVKGKDLAIKKEEPKEKICPLCQENLGIDGKLLIHYKTCPKRNK